MMAKKYLRLKGPIIFTGAVEKHVAEYKQRFAWVDDPNEATRDYAEVMVPTRDKLRSEFGVETELEQVPDDKLMTPKFVITSDQS